MISSGVAEQAQGVGRVSFKFPKLHPTKKAASKCASLKKISVEVPEGRVQGRSYKSTDFRVQKVDDSQNKTCPLFRSYSPDNFLIVSFDPKCPFDAVQKFLLDGLTVRYGDDPRVDVFVFFGHSASQLRQRACVLYNQMEGKTENVLQRFGQFDRIKDVAKRAARIGLLFSTAEPTYTLNEEQISSIPDIERGEYNFTDGCGFLSSHVALEVTRSLEINSLYENIKSPAVPSVYQIRFKGCKGVLAHNPGLRRGIQIRPSLEKFQWLLGGPSILGVVDRGYSRPYEFGSLNKQYIMLLSALGIPDDVFLRKQAGYFRELGEITSNYDVAFRFLCVNEEFEMAEKLLKTGNLDKRTTAKLEHLRNRVRERQRSTEDNPFKKPKKSAAERLKIPIEQSRNVYGVCDPSGRLEPGTVFFQPTIGDKPVILHTCNRVVVAKNPCYHPGDIRVLQCVDEPECRHLVDCIVFPTNGDRPHPDEIAGSDLDGDKYFVCWDRELVPETEAAPCQYPAAKPQKKEVITREDCVRYFSRYSNAIVGKLDHLFERWADERGVNSPECILIAALFSRAIDAAKTGEKVNIPKTLLAAPSNVQLKGDFVWLKLLERAKLFESDLNLEVQITGNVTCITEEDMLNILKNKESRCSEYRLFRFLYKWCEHVGKVDIAQYLHYIDFCKFTTEQIENYRVTVDVPGIDLEMLLNPLHQSNILSREDIEAFSNSPSISRRRWRLLYRADGKEVSWKMLDNVFTSPVQKLVIFKFLLGGLEWVISIVMAMPLESHEVITIDEEDDTEAATAHVSVHSGSGTVPPLTLGKGYSFSWEGERLDIYTGKKQNTFICLKKGDIAEEGPVMSVALDRFQGNLPRKYQTRIRKETFLAAEVFCLCDGSDAGYTVRQISSAAAYEEDVAAPQQRQEQFRAKQSDFPRIDASPEELLSELERVYKKLHDSLQTGQLQKCQLDQLWDLMVAAQEANEEECHDIACHLESFLWKADATAAFTSSKRYKQLIASLLIGLRDFRLDTVLGEETRITLTRRVRRCLETMWRYAVQFSLEDISEILYMLLLGNDYNTACQVIGLFRKGYFPLDNWTFHPNALPYCLHFVSLVAMEALEEVKQATLAAQSRKTPITAQATQRDEEEETFTLLVTSGPHPFRRGGGVALSCSHVFKREFVAEVTDVTGNMLTITMTWPSSITYASLKDVITARTSQWRVFPFPSLVGYKRVLSAFKTLRHMHSNAEALFDQIVGSFTCADDVNTDECKGSRSRDNADHVVQRTKDRETEGTTSVETAETVAGFSLNESQEEAVKDVLGGLSVTLIQGPPGTGKTVTCAEIVRRWLLVSSEPVLIVAETNEGVDNLMKKLVKLGSIVRIGSSGWSVANELKQFTLEQLYKKRVSEKKGQFHKMDKKVVKKIVRDARVVCTTCISSGSNHLEGHVFRRVLVDEASQATEPVILVATSHGCQQLVLVGDDQQLPPMVQCEQAKGPSGLSTPLFTRMRSVGVNVRMLEIQYRMHPTIALFPSKTFYGGRLRNGVSTEDRKPPSGFDWPCSQKPVAFISMPDSCLERSKGPSKLNDSEATLVSHLIRELVSRGDVSRSQIGVVTPYRAQLERISHLISELGGDIAVRTVDGFQGQERDVIVFSAVRCNEHGFVGFLDDAKRMNVLLTRARRGLIVVGNRRTLSCCETWKRWIQWADEEHLVCQHHPEQTTIRGSEQVDNCAGAKRNGRGRRGNSSRGTSDVSRQERGRGDVPNEGRNQQGSARRGGRGKWKNSGRAKSSKQ